MTQGKYIRTKEHRETHSKIAKEWFKNNEHPRGMLGKKPWNKGKKGLQVAWNKGLKRNWKSLTEFKKGKENINYGRTTATVKGKDHPNWKGGITPQIVLLRQSAMYQIWRNAVFLRDDFTCQDCGLKGSYLHAHHIKSFADFPNLRFKIENGQTLCKNCHAKLHVKLRKTALVIS